MDPEPTCPGSLPMEEKTIVKQELETEHSSCALAVEPSSINAASVSEVPSENDGHRMIKMEDDCSPCIPCTPMNTEPATTLSQVESCSMTAKTEPASISQAPSDSDGPGMIKTEDKRPSCIPYTPMNTEPATTLSQGHSYSVSIKTEIGDSNSRDTSREPGTAIDQLLPSFENASQIPTGDAFQSVLVKQEDLPEKSQETRQDSEDSEDDSSTSSSSSSTSSESESETEESSSSSDSSSSDDERRAPIRGARHSDSEEDFPDRLALPPKTAKEVLVMDLPPVQPIDVILDSTEELKPVGVVSSIIGQLVVIQSSLGVEALDSDTVLFRDNRQAIGVIFEVFGPVIAPLYTVRFNSLTDVQHLKIELKMPVFFAPRIPDMTTYVFTQRLKQLKGSDASWENDEEPPAECVEYSDDEQERAVKNKKKNYKRKRKTPNPSRNNMQDVVMATDESLPSRHQFPSSNRHGYHESTNQHRPRGRATFDARPRQPFQNWRGRGMPRPPFGHRHPRPPFGPPWHPQAYQQYGSSFNPDQFMGLPGTFNPQGPTPYGDYSFPPPPPPPPNPHPNSFNPPPPPPPPPPPGYPNMHNHPPPPPPPPQPTTMPRPFPGSNYHTYI